MDDYRHHIEHEMGFDTKALSSLESHVLRAYLVFERCSQFDARSGGVGAQGHQAVFLQDDEQTENSMVISRASHFVA